MVSHLVKIAHAEAAHFNPNGSAAAQRLHGHSYKIEILASGTPDETIGWIVDFAELKKLFAPVLAQLDHALLNEIPGLERDTTLPALQRWIMEKLSPGASAWLDGVRVSIVGDLRLKLVHLEEDEFEHLPDRIRFTFEAAQSLPQLPGAHPCKKIHGHSYRMEIGAKQMDALAAALPEFYAVVDHTYLNEIPGLESATTERICRWTWDWLAARGIAPTVVVVQETATARCLYYGE